LTGCRRFAGKAEGTRGCHGYPVEILDIEDRLEEESGKNRRRPSKGKNGKEASNGLLRALNRKSFFR
jgi:hypothetical protein